jgi:class 3 adenylate cyclase/pimeloyl-ACP methyl ester carboxylesterase
VLEFCFGIPVNRGEGGMQASRTRRRLAAIVCADVAGYSRLMGVDEDGTLARVNALRHELMAPRIRTHHGRIVKTTGDGLLIEFASAASAVRCAIEIQAELAQRNAGVPEEHRIELRIGINLGDIIHERGDVFGDGVNVAARVEPLAEPGGIAMTSAVCDQVRDRVPDLSVDDLGEQRFKNIARPIRCFRVRLDGAAAPAQEPEASALHQEIRFCTASDGVRIAYATVGQGPPIVKPATWMTHLEYDWHSPVWRHWIRELARDRCLIRYDERANGLSDWDVGELSFDAFIRDFEAVVDAAGLARFPIFGMSQGCAVAAAYAARYPERVSCLVLYGGYARGWALRGTPAEVARRRALETLIEHGWGQDNPAFRQVFTTLFIPEATADQMQWFNDLQRMTTSPENALRLHHCFGDIDVRALLPQVRAPTLVFHCRNEGVVPFEEGRILATAIPGARFVPLEGRNHVILETEPAWEHFLTEARAFLASQNA